MTEPDWTHGLPQGPSQPLTPTGWIDNCARIADGLHQRTRLSWQHHMIMIGTAAALLATAALAILCLTT